MRVSKWWHDFHFWLHHPWAGYQNDWWSETLHILQQHNHTRSHSESIHKWFSIRSINKCKNNVSNLCPAHVSQGNMSPSLLLPKELPEDGFVGGSWEAHVAPHGQTGEGLPPDAVWRSGRCDWRCLTISDEQSHGVAGAAVLAFAWRWRYRLDPLICGCRERYNNQVLNVF